MGFFRGLILLNVAIAMLVYWFQMPALREIDYAGLDARYSEWLEVPKGTSPYLVVIVNPFSGTAGADEGVSALAIVVEEFTSNNVAFQVKFTKRKGHGEELAHAAALLKRVYGVVAVGGDGSIGDVARGLIASGVDPSQMPALGLVPAGTGNGMAMNLHRTEDISTAIKAIVKGETGGLDAALLKIKDQEIYVIHNTFNGVMADTNALSDKFRWMGNFRYTFAGILQIIYPIQKHVGTFVFTLPGGATRIIEGETTIMMLGVDGPYSSTDLKFWPGSSHDDGLLNACIVGEFRRMQLVQTLIATKEGTVQELPFVDLFKFTKVVATSATGPLSYDGEPPLGEYSEFSLEVLPRALRVFGG